jgi:hypothetical protein
MNLGWGMHMEGLVRGNVCSRVFAGPIQSSQSMDLSKTIWEPTKNPYLREAALAAVQ